MASFKDDKGRSWLINITASTVRRVKELTGVYLPSLADDQFKGFNDLAQDVVLFLDVLYAVVQPDAEKNGVTIEQLGDALGGDACERAAEAFTNGIVDFFHESRRGVLRTLLEKSKRFRTLMTAKAEKELETLDPQKMVDEWLANQNPSPIELKDSSGSVPASSDSTPAPSASENSSP